MSSTILIIAEKPSVGREIAQALMASKSPKDGCIEGYREGQPLVVSWVHGHLVELCPPDAYNADFKQWNVPILPVYPPDWKFKDMVRSGAEKQYKVIKSIVDSLPRGAEVVNACDAGREGELIFYKVLRNMKAESKVKFTRMWYQSTTVEDFRRSFDDRQDYDSGHAGPVIYSGLRESSIVRDESDWFLGMNGTRLFTCGTPVGSFQIPAKGKQKAKRLVKRIGRVKTPTMAMIVERDELIDNFIPQDFFEVEGHFPSGSGRSDLSAYLADRLDLLGVNPQDKTDEKKVFWEKVKADAFAAAASGNYSVSDEGKKVSSRPPMAYSLTTAQREGNKRFGWSAAHTLEVLQGLYEKGLLSYPRTEYSGIPTNLKDQVVSMLSKVHGKVSELPGGNHFSKQSLPGESTIRNSKVFDDSKIGDHYALMPTGEMGQFASLSGDAATAFLMIYESVLCAVDEPAQFKEVLRTWQQQNTSGDYAPAVFTCKSKLLLDAGWTRWTSKDNQGSELEALKVSEEPLSGAEVKSKKTTAPKHYNEATLLRAMETAGTHGYEDEDDDSYEDRLISLMKGKGLGTPATRASIIEELKKHNYIKVQKNSIISTPMARELIGLVRDRSPQLASAKETAEWENELHKMEEGAPDALNRIEFLERLKGEFLAYKKVCEDRGIPKMGGSSKILDVLCPKSGQPVTEGEKLFRFPGYNKVGFWKNFWGRDMTVEEWMEVIKKDMAGEELELSGFTTRDGKKTYEGTVYLNKDRWAVRSASSGAPAKEIGVMCPKSGKPLLEMEKLYKSPAYEDIPLWKIGFGQEMSPERWVEVLKATKSNPHLLENCVSKKGTNYSILLWVSRGKLKSEFPKK